MQHGHGDSGVPVVHALKNESSVQRQSAGGDIALANRTQNGTLTYIGEEVDQLSPGWAVLLMYLMLVNQMRCECCLDKLGTAGD